MGSAPSAPSNLDSRGVTRGAYRGLGEVYDVNVPSGVIVEGSNTVCHSSILSFAEEGYDLICKLLCIGLE